MKRAHRTVHRLVWIALLPALAVIVITAWQARDTTALSNDNLPGAVSAGELP